ncbi:alpha/beta fold hydrolase [Ketogulonicigenium vulgare]|uniref:Predicted hydrolase or acyltransferase of alpha/beta superfamily protein n=1 Tax=Ketogulonicigenium vulgare (strain WSH-001) TaxID=759362 RepID=F9Y5Y4_KETVW|nr:alpha/beta fold hydrolase [Ketogulonicigenium vulgare]ADO42618.1 proline iminopeptidase [Ketogulonicigenium vulgare Y25]AEM40809.1 predicted hydrolase or acyltransferase of alpha/beta superfamily protein [Ketogulonicigenium vulgare WSH-001]ALJ80974.1 hydrolase [Ketogulonicigenium vulgare]ANW33739.1 hydrolase [Ketogulonicigenium vulgare]AOZ54527.1 proline iminopeptidase [Ketogulonicigenium vulgare]
MFLTINGCELYVEMLGGDDPAKPLIIAHHGAPGLGSHTEPKKSFGSLSDEYRVLVFDARGSGASGDEGPFTHEQWAADIDALRQWAGEERIIIAGGSYGGYMSMEYAIRYPQHVIAMVLRDTAPDNSFRAGSDARARNSDRITISAEDEDLYLRQREGRVRNNEEFKKSWGMILPLYDHKLDMDKVRERIETTPYHYATHNYAFSVNQKNFDLKPQLKDLKVPVLITVGRHDWITPVAASEKLHELLENSELKIFEHSGHSPQVEEADLWRATVRDFLRRHI